MKSPKHSQTTLLNVGGALYYVRPRVEACLPQQYALRSGSVPTTVIHAGASSEHLSAESIQSAIARLADQDDVFQSDFAADGILLVYPKDPSRPASDSGTNGLDLSEIPNEALSPNLADLLRERSLRIFTVDPSHIIPEGPYITQGSHIHQAWRLFPDTLSAFTSPVVPDDGVADGDEPRGHFTSPPWAQPPPHGGMIAIPSRLYSQKSTLPLAGLRIALKDNMHLSGVTTFLGSKAYAELYGPQPSSALIADKLVQAGAVIVGKTKLSAFAGSEIPPNDCVDYFPPWNPRGDGYQNPSGSSSGPAASVAGYEWLDVSMCTDTTGSGRTPATANGVWGHRMTWNGDLLQGIVPACELFDAVGILSRSPTKIERVISVLSPPESEADQWRKPLKIVYPTDWYPLEDSEHQAMIEDFLKRLEDFTSVERTNLSLTEEWTRSAPEEFRGMTLKEFIGRCPNDYNLYDNLHNFDKFKEDYHQKFGKKPYASPEHQERWDDGAPITLERKDECLKKVMIFRKWALSVLFPDDRTVVIAPLGRPGPNYRDSTKNGSNRGSPSGALGPIFMVPQLGVPLVIAPIGQKSYQSRASGLEEFVGIFTTLIGAPSSDLDLVRLAKETLEASRRPTEVMAGRYMFTPPTALTSESIKASI